MTSPSAQELLRTLDFRSPVSEREEVGRSLWQVLPEVLAPLELTRLDRARLLALELPDGLGETIDHSQLSDDSRFRMKLLCEIMPLLLRVLPGVNLSVWLRTPNLHPVFGGHSPLAAWLAGDALTLQRARMQLRHDTRNAVGRRVMQAWQGRGVGGR